MSCSVRHWETDLDILHVCLEKGGRLVRARLERTISSRFIAKEMGVYSCTWNKVWPHNLQQASLPPLKHVLAELGSCVCQLLRHFASILDWDKHFAKE